MASCYFSVSMPPVELVVVEAARRFQFLSPGSDIAHVWQERLLHTYVCDRGPCPPRALAKLSADLTAASFHLLWPGVRLGSLLTLDKLCKLWVLTFSHPQNGDNSGTPHKAIYVQWLVYSKYAWIVHQTTEQRPACPSVYNLMLLVKDLLFLFLLHMPAKGLCSMERGVPS